MMADNVVSISPHIRTINAPPPLCDVQGWMIWRFEDNLGGGKPLKMPYYADGGRRTGKQGAPADRGRLVTFAAARDAAAKRNFDGVGIALMHEWGVTALDFDACVGPDGSVPDEIARVINVTYAEYSPSGRGIRAFVRGDLGNHKSHAKDGCYGFETFATTGYVTFTGNVLPNNELLGYDEIISDATDEVRALCSKHFKGSSSLPDESDDPFAGLEPRLNLAIDRMQELLDVLDPDMSRDEWIKVGMALHHETEGDDTGFGMWNGWSSGGDKYPSEDGLRAQWESFTRRMGPGRRQVTMATVVWMAKIASRAAAGSATDAVLAMIETPPTFEGRFRVSAAKTIVDRPPPQWVIKDILARGDLGVVYGPPGSGKSFVSFAGACAVSQGVPWLNRRTKKGRVIVVVAEGIGGFGKRIKAHCKHHSLPPEELALGLILDTPNVLKQDDVSDLIRSINAAGGADLIVIDTFAQVTPGANENTAEDMGLALSHIAAIRKATGAAVLLVHHAGKDVSRGARGWSGIKAAVDSEIEVVRHDTGVREMRLTKLKDGDDDASWAFRLERVVVGVDEDGDEISSCVVIDTEVPVPAAATAEDRKTVKRLSSLEAHISEMIDHVPAKEHAMSLSDFVDFCVKGMPSPAAGTRDVRRQNVMRSVRALAKMKDGPLTLQENTVLFHR